MLRHYRDLLDDRIRIEMFRKAITELVDPSKVVAEIGSALGTYSFFAVRAEAKRVYAIEMSDIFQVGLELARRNRMEDKIQFFFARSTEVNLPEQVDLIIMEDYSPFLLYSGLETTIRDARQRFLKPGGNFIPNNFELKLALVEYPTFFHQLHLWEKEQDILFDLDWSYTTDLIFNETHYADDRPKQLLTAEYSVKTIDLRSCDDFMVNFHQELTIERPGIVHGILGWWDCWFTPRQFFSNSPQLPNNTWGQMFFPLRYPIPVQTSDKITLSLLSLPAKYSGQIHFKWQVEHAGNVQEYNTFRATAPDPQRLRQFQLTSTPRLSRDGQVQQFILNHLDGQHSWTEIAALLCTAFPDVFQNTEQALTKISEISARLTLDR